MRDIVIHDGKVYIGKQVCVLTYRDGRKSFVGEYQEYCPPILEKMKLLKTHEDDFGEKYVSLDEVMDVLRGGNGRF